MSLFEATWPDTPSLLLSAYTAGEALHYIRQTLGSHRVYQLDELVELKQENHVLVLQCGELYTDLPADAFAYCPDSETRLFVVEQLERGDAPEPAKRPSAVFVVKDLNQLPALVLWHFGMLSEAQSLIGGLVVETWTAESKNYQILEVNTKRNGVLLSYHYCTCATRPSDEDADRHKSEPHEMDLD